MFCPECGGKCIPAPQCSDSCYWCQKCEQHYAYNGDADPPCYYLIPQGQQCLMAGGSDGE